MLKTFKYIFHILLILLLTILTQVGGLIYIIVLLLQPLVRRRIHRKAIQRLATGLLFMVLYLLSSFIIIPAIARPLGRVPLPVTHRGNLQPLTILTCLLNRHYVRPALKKAAENVADELQQAYPGTVLHYLDANFPFFQGFPLLPHLSHNDGKKLDLAFCYIDRSTGKFTNDCPSFIGYGISEEPKPGEVNTAIDCEQVNHYYSILRTIVPQGDRDHYRMDERRTKAIVQFFVAQPAIGKLFIEPHLKQRMQLHNKKIRFQGCQAVRHDDHIHVQL